MLQNKKSLFSFIAIGLSLVMVLTGILLSGNESFASWVEEEEGIRYEREDGQYAVGFLDIDEFRYYFDKDGYLVTGKFYVEEDNAYYFSDDKGILQIGVIELENAFYVTDETGKIKIGFVEQDGKRYYFNEQAELVKGWLKEADNWYYADDQGVILTGFINVDGYRYYLNTDGTRISDTVMDIDGITYVFNKDGSIDENATTLYPVFECLNVLRRNAGLPDLIMNSKVQACAVLRAAKLTEGYQAELDSVDSIEVLLKNRGVMCTGGYEFSYGGIEEYTIDRLILNIKKDVNILSIINNAEVKEIGLGFFEQDGKQYYDILLINTI